MFIVGTKVICSISVVWGIFSSKTDVEGVIKNVGPAKLFVDFSGSKEANDPECSFTKKQLVDKNECAPL